MIIGQMTVIYCYAKKAFIIAIEHVTCIDNNVFRETKWQEQITVADR